MGRAYPVVAMGGEKRGAGEIPGPAGGRPPGGDEAEAVDEIYDPVGIPEGAGHPFGEAPPLRGGRRPARAV